MNEIAQKLRDLAGDLETYNVMSRYPQGLLDAADAIDAQAAKIAEAESQIDRHRRASERWKKVAESTEERARDQAAEIARLRMAAQAADDALTMYERYGEICPFEGEPMIHASTLVELGELARAALAQEQGGSDDK